MFFVQFVEECTGMIVATCAKVEYPRLVVMSAKEECTAIVVAKYVEKQCTRMIAEMFADMECTEMVGISVIQRCIVWLLWLEYLFRKLRKNISCVQAQFLIYKNIEVTQSQHSTEHLRSTARLFFDSVLYLLTTDQYFCQMSFLGFLVLRLVQVILKLAILRQ